MNSLLIGPGLPGGMMGSLMNDLQDALDSLNKYFEKNNKPKMNIDQLLIKLFDEVAYVWPKMGYPPLVTPFSQYVKNMAQMNVIMMEKGKERWSMIADDIWDMMLGKSGRLPGELAPELVEIAKAQGREFFTGNPQDAYPDALENYKKMMQEKGWELGQDDEELFEYAMHPAQYEAYKSGEAKANFNDAVAKAKAKKECDEMPKEAQVLTVDVNGEKYKVTVAFGEQAATPAESAPASASAAPSSSNGNTLDVLSPLEGKFYLIKNPSDKPLKVGDVVKKGQVLCYIESMKTYNAVFSEFDGKVAEICVTSSTAVNEDDLLMIIE